MEKSLTKSSRQCVFLDIDHLRLNRILLQNRRFAIRRFTLGLVLVAVALVCAGCDSGPALIPVKGQVQFKIDGTTAQFGSIEFRNENEPHEISRATIQKDGTFELRCAGRRGTVAGWYTVVIIQVVGNPRTGTIDHHHGLDISKKYLDHRTTDLRVEITDAHYEEPLILKVDDKTID